MTFFSYEQFKQHFLDGNINVKPFNYFVHKKIFPEGISLEGAQIPNKLALFGRFDHLGVKTPKFLFRGDIHEEPPMALPERFCLKPCESSTGIGVFLMCDGVNLCTGKKYESFKEIREDYIRAVTPFKQYVDRYLYYVETLLVDDKKKEPPDDFKLYCFKDHVAWFVQKKRFFKQSRIVYDTHWNRIVSGGQHTDLLLKPDVLIQEQMRKTAQDIMRELSVSFLRIDLYNVNGDIYLGELNTRPAGTGNSFFVFGEEGDIINHYNGYLLEHLAGESR